MRLLVKTLPKSLLSKFEGCRCCPTEEELEETSEPELDPALMQLPYLAGVEHLALFESLQLLECHVSC